MARHCLSLLSGGLDSLLVLRLMVLAGLKVTAVHSVNTFQGTQKLKEKKEGLRQTALSLGAADIVFPDITDEVVEVTKRPQHGYGKHMNACIDCRMRTVKAGFAVMQELGADFIVSGEVTGQRPMSQRRDAIELADREFAAMGVGGLLLRPLCAKLLPKTIPETEGWVTTDCLFDISGRGRDRQMALAEEIGIRDYPIPAGGCLLTDPAFAERLAVMTRYNPEWTKDDAELLKIGRHYQISAETKIVASRCEEENYRLRDLATPDDRLYIAKDRPGAIVMLRGGKTPEAEAIAAGLAVHYSKMRGDGRATIESWRVENDDVDKQDFVAELCDPDAARGLERSLTGGNSLKVMRAAASKRNQRQHTDNA